MDDYIKAYEYEKNVNPFLKTIPIRQHHINNCNYGITFIDFSDLYNGNYKATTPNLLASFIKLLPNKSISVPYNKTNFFQRNSYFFLQYISKVYQCFFYKNSCIGHLPSFISAGIFIGINIFTTFALQFITKLQKKYKFIKCEKPEENRSINATSHLFYVLKGKCEIVIDQEKFIVSNGDIFISPLFNSMVIHNLDDNDLQIYYVNDSPLINYLGSKPTKKIFKPAIYSKKFLWKNLNTLSDPNNNRKGILLSNQDTEKIGTNTITPTLWALFNELPAHTVQKPHKHNSVALDLCILCEDSDNSYTLVGDELDENGQIINPIRVNWKEGEMFITPPGLWHSHNNVGNTPAYVIPIQDAGLLLYQRILGIDLR